MKKVLKTFKLNDIQKEDLKSQYYQEMGALEGTNSTNPIFERVDPKQFCEIVNFADLRVCKGFVNDYGLYKLERFLFLGVEIMDNVSLIYHITNNLKKMKNDEPVLIGFKSDDEIYFNLEMMF